MMEGGFNAEQLAGLQNMLAENDQDDESHVYGSALTPGSLHMQGKEKKEIAKPHAQVEVKTYNREIGGGAPKDAIEAARAAIQKAKPKNQIWSEEEVNVKAEELPDDRPAPEYDIKHMQHVGTEDMFLGLSDKDSSQHDSVLVKVWLPNTKFS